MVITAVARVRGSTRAHFEARIHVIIEVPIRSDHCVVSFDCFERPLCPPLTATVKYSYDRLKYFGNVLAADGI
jgi:hypothetical protein